MKFQQVIQAVYYEPWAITHEGWQAVHAIVRARLEDLKAPMPKAEDPDQDLLGNELPKLQVTEDGVAIIPVMGTLMQHASLMAKRCGACSYQDISRDLDTARGVRALQKIVLHVGSPGGMCLGNQEVAAKVAAIRESGIRIEAVTDTQICSAAYNLVAGVHRISSTSTAYIGSVGAMSALLDSSLAYEMEGLKVEMIRSGPLKGVGMPGTALSPEQRDYLQGLVDKFAGMFKDHVRQYRPVDEETMQGQVFIGSAAREAGLVDELVEEVSDVLGGGGELEEET